MINQQPPTYREDLWNQVVRQCFNVMDLEMAHKIADKHLAEFDKRFGPKTIDQHPNPLTDSEVHALLDAYHNGSLQNPLTEPVLTALTLAEIHEIITSLGVHLTNVKFASAVQQSIAAKNNMRLVQP